MATCSGIRSERQLEVEVHSNIAYRWFLGFGLTEHVPDHSTLSYFRERLREGDVLEKVFNEVVLLGIKHRLVAGCVLIVALSTKADVDELDEAVQADREVNGKSLETPKGGGRVKED